MYNYGVGSESGRRGGLAVFCRSIGSNKSQGECCYFCTVIGGAATVVVVAEDAQRSHRGRAPELHACHGRCAIRSLPCQGVVSDCWCAIEVLSCGGG